MYLVFKYKLFLVNKVLKNIWKNLKLLLKSLLVIGMQNVFFLNKKVDCNIFIMLRN